MSVYAEVVAWSAGLPGWQRDALRRIAAAPLTPADHDELAAMCLAEANQLPVVPAPQPLSAAHVPGGGASGPTVTLLAVKDTKSINALLDGQSLTFGPSGITIIYGDNGAGKSGFARVLRHACHARGPSSTPISNVYTLAPGAPAAVVAYAVGGVANECTWTSAGQVPPELARVSVFDTVAASQFVETENAIIWTPGGLDLLEHLVRGVDAVRRRIEQTSGASASRGALPSVAAGSSANQFLRAISANTDSRTLDALVLRPEEEAELGRLDAALSTPDPGAATPQIQQRAARFRALATRVATMETAFGPQGMTELRDLREAFDAATLAEVQLARSTFGDSTVPGVGEAAWRTLWQAAENYARSGATSDGQFPSTSSPALCVLCQQDLPAATQNRLNRFHTFVRADVAQRRSSAATALAQGLATRGAVRTAEASDPGVLAEIALIDQEGGARLAGLLQTAAAAQSTVGGLGLTQQPWTIPHPLPGGWSAWIEALAGQADAEAATLLQTANPIARATQVARRNELRARKQLSDGRALVEAEIARLKRQAQLLRAAAACVTTGITRKSGELTKAYVADKLVELFAGEARALRLPQTVAYRPARNEKGTSFQQVILTSAPWATKVGQPVHVLSEGERRAVALAAFLAELGTRTDPSAVVLDDPVSSLDHDRRRTVAERLAEVARSRQTIIFTHDLVFLHMLKVAAEERGVPVTDREVRRAGTTAGYCRDKAPAKAMPVKTLVGELKAHQQICATQHRAGEMDAYERDLTGMTHEPVPGGRTSGRQNTICNARIVVIDGRMKAR